MSQQDLPKNQLQMIRFFADPRNAHEFLVAVRWPEGVKCPRCNSDKVGKFSGKRMVSNCKNCKKQFTVKVGTIFEDSPLGLDKWFAAFWMVINAKNGVSSCELSRNLGITQKSAWHMAHRIRVVLESGTFTKLDGIVEVDESFIGGAARFMHKSTKLRRGITGTGGMGKTAVMGLLERHSKDKHSRIIAKVVPNTRRKSLDKNVREYVLKNAEIHTDALRSYNKLSDEYTHKVVDHAECYVKNNVHTNGLENFWSLLKRSIKGTYVSCAPFHLHRYLGEQVYRFNERKEDDSGRFMKAVSSTTGRRLKYFQLIGNATA